MCVLLAWFESKSFCGPTVAILVLEHHASTKSALAMKLHGAELFFGSERMILIMITKHFIVGSLGHSNLSTSCRGIPKLDLESVCRIETETETS